MPVLPSPDVHVFDNGVHVLDRHLVAGQRERYRAHNVHESLEEEIFVRAVAAMPEEGCFVSVGCAIGYYLILARRLAPRIAIHAVEPLERHRRRALQNLALNGFDADSVVLHPEGIAAARGTASFLDEGYASSALVGTQRRPFLFWLKHGLKRALTRSGIRDFSDEVARISTIETISLADLLARIARPVDLLQMDVQGLEGDILEAARDVLARRAVTTFLIGTHGREVHARCARSFAEAGYRILHDDPEPGTQPDGLIAATCAAE